MNARPMTIKLDRIPEGEPLDVIYSDTLPAFNEMLRAIAESKGSKVFGEAELQLESWPGRVDVTGWIRVRADMTCVRCLNPFPLEVERKIVHILMRSLEGIGGDEETELTGADLDRSLIKGDSIDLAEVLREELLLGMPMKAICNEACKGICAGCGVQLNDEACICKPKVDERWGTLTALKAEDC
jgi:uncharacterized protein